MQVFWEKVRILGLGLSLREQGRTHREIAAGLDIGEIKVGGCVAWILQFLTFTKRLELVQYASSRTAAGLHA